MLKKILSSMLILSIPFVSLTTVGCSYFENKKQEFVDEINKIIYTSEIPTRVNIYSKINSLNSSDLIKKIKNLNLNNLTSQNIFKDDVTYEDASTLFLGTDSPTIKFTNTVDNASLKSSSMSDIITMLPTISEALGLFNLPLDTSIINLITQIMSNSTFGSLNTLIAPLLYDNTSSILNTESIENFSTAFKPLISEDNPKNITNGQALTMAFYNIFHCLYEKYHEDIPSSSSFSEPIIVDTIPQAVSLDYSTFIHDFASAVYNKTINFSLTDIDPTIFQSIFIIINYVLNFFNSSDNQNLYLMSDNEFNNFKVPDENDSAFDYMFSKTKTNSEIIQDINNQNFKNGVSLNEIKDFLNSFSNNFDTGISFNRLLIILTGSFENSNDSSSHNYNSFIKLLFDFMGGILSSSIDDNEWKIVTSMVQNDHLFSDLERNFTINSFIDDINSVIAFLPTDIADILNTKVVPFIKNNKSFYANNSTGNDIAPNHYNSGSISNFWNSTFLLNFLNLITSTKSDNSISIFGYKLVGNNLNEIILNLLNEIKINIDNVDLSLEDLVLILKNMFSTLIQNKNNFMIQSSYIYEIFSQITLSNNPDLYTQLQDDFFSLLEKRYNNQIVIASETHCDTWEEFQNSAYFTELKNKPILVYFLIEISDKSLASDSDIYELMGIDDNNNFIKNGYGNLFNIINEYQDFFNTFLIGMIQSFITKLLSDINSFIPDSVSSANNWIITNKKYTTSSNYDLPNEIYYTISFSDLENNDIVSYNVKLILYSENNIKSYKNIEITKIN